MSQNFIFWRRTLPHELLFQFSNMQSTITADLLRWLPEENKKLPVIENLRFVIISFPEFRNLFYYRIENGQSISPGWLLKLAKLCYQPMNTLFIIATPKIGPGLFIQHGFATIISAQKIGKNCQINQQVTIGYSDKVHKPTIGDDVIIYAGAKIIGDVVVGDHVKIGANAVVIKDVPSNCTVVGVPAYIVRRNGKKVRQKLKKRGKLG